MGLVQGPVGRTERSTLQVSRRIGLYPRVRVETVRKVGLDTAISAAPAPWRRPRTVHDPGKVLLDIALATALGGD